jgi:GGDEF domain-containing protein
MTPLTRERQVMDKNQELVTALNNLTNALRSFVELSSQETDPAWEDWLGIFLKEGESKCWEKKKCSKKDCPSYLNTSLRCWLAAGTLCGGKPLGEFAKKYKSCIECDVYQEAVFKDPVTAVNEHIITLIHGLKSTIRDPLTGVYNRNFFNEMIANEINRSKRYGEQFSIVILDIDNFKKINDDHGHLIGDWILKECASIISRSIRASDVLVRFGGDEFLVVSPETDFKDCDGLTACKLSVSIGAALFEQGRNLMEVIKEADARMYKNKSSR